MIALGRSTVREACVLIVSLILPPTIPQLLLMHRLLEPLLQFVLLLHVLLVLWHEVGRGTKIINGFVVIHIGQERLRADQVSFLPKRG